MISIIFILIFLLILFFIKNNIYSKNKIDLRPKENISYPSKKIQTTPSLKLEEVELSKNYKKIIFFLLESNNLSSEPSHIIAIKMAFNLKTGDLIYLNEFKEKYNLGKFKIFSQDTLHLAFYNLKSDAPVLNLDKKYFSTMLTNTNIVEIKNSSGRNRWPKLLEIAKYYGIKYNNQIELSSIKKIKLNIQIFQKMLKHPKASIFVQDFLFNDNSYLNKL
ncbi:hypothetical protein NON08_13740 [Cetobacterium somerae]|uniref:hypothetical protein n=1 Tax=Cetobacterium sp. NK01 TaxID=2993530 RepID=UPI0021167A79|nr:hypothetical protein [Cetobacterium sp. NK01]MCQ8213564.1 hypothetical protein [Cetobacterium sp. NK01]